MICASEIARVHEIEGREHGVLCFVEIFLIAKNRIGFSFLENFLEAEKIAEKVNEAKVLFSSNFYPSPTFFLQE